MIKEKIKDKLDQYLEFDSSRLFFDPLVRIFGGAIRDCIADQPIHDIDILVGSKSRVHLEHLLAKNGYTFLESQYPKDLASVYTDLKVISEPYTWTKGSKIVQIIRPRLVWKLVNEGSTKNDPNAYQQAFNNLIYNVDLSCCGVSWDGKNLYENYPNAVLHCLTKTFQENSSAAMRSEQRVMHRKHKLEDRGWQQISTKEDIRDNKINGILDTNDLNYIPYAE